MVDKKVYGVPDKTYGIIDVGAKYSAKSYEELPPTDLGYFWYRTTELGKGYWEYELITKNVVTKEPRTFEEMAKHQEANKEQTKIKFDSYLKNAHLIPGLTQRYEEMKSEDPQWDETYLRWLPAAGEILETPLGLWQGDGHGTSTKIEDDIELLATELEEQHKLIKNTRFVMWFLVSALVVEGVAKLIGVWN